MCSMSNVRIFYGPIMRVMDIILLYLYVMDSTNADVAITHKIVLERDDPLAVLAFTRCIWKYSLC